MLFYQNTKIDIDAVREYAATQTYDSLKHGLDKFQFELNIDDAEDCRVSTNWEEHRLYSFYISLKTIDKIRSGASIVDMSFIGLITSYWVVPHNPTNEINCEPKGVDYFDIETEIDEEEILHGYDLRRFFFVYYALSDVSIRASILDKLIWELGLRDSKDDPDSVVVLEYLTRFRELIQSQPEQTLQKQPQEQIYSISTNLTEKQLIALLGRLKDKEFVAPEQTEVDFLNAFNPNAAKQGKIKWIKRSGSRTDKPVCKTAIVDFIYRIICDNIKEVELIHNVEVIFGITINKSTVSDVSRRNAKKASEYSEVFADIFAEIANL